MLVPQVYCINVQFKSIKKRDEKCTPKNQLKVTHNKKKSATIDMGLKKNEQKIATE